MRCSDCSKPIRPIVAVDIDGTLGDYHRDLQEFAVDWLGTSMPSCAPYDGTERYREWFMRTFSVDLETFRAVKLAYRQGGKKRSMPIFPGASDFVRRLREDLDVEVWLTTTRPWERYDRTDPDTKEWLSRNDITFDALLYSGDKMKILDDSVDNERVVAVIDDQMDVLLEANNMFGPVAVLRRNYYNGGLKWDREFYDYNTAIGMIDRMVEGWRDRHGC